MQFNAHVENEAARLVGELAAAAPGDLKVVLANIVGQRPLEDAEQPVATGRLGPLWWAPGLLALCCRVYGQPAEKAIPMGACLRLLGAAAGVLDSAQDREDNSMRRYLGMNGERSLAGTTGAGANNPDEVDLIVALTMNAGIALIGLGWRALLENGPQYGVDASTLVETGRLLADLSMRMCYGQHVDLAARSGIQSSPNLPHQFPLTLEDYERVARDKSGELGGTVCEIAAVLAGAQEHRLLWRKLGTDWMTALQLKDDYADLDEDLAAGRLTHSVLYGLEVGDETQKDRILGLLSGARAETPQSSVARRELIALLEGMGGLHYTLAMLSVLRRQMLATLGLLSVGKEEHELLSSFILFVAPEADS